MFAIPVQLVQSGPVPVGDERRRFGVISSSHENQGIHLVCGSPVNNIMEIFQVSITAVPFLSAFLTLYPESINLGFPATKRKGRLCVIGSGYRSAEDRNDCE